MTNEQIEGLIKLGILVTGAVTTIVLPLRKYYSFKETQAKENSLGVTKVKELEKIIDGLEELIESLTNKIVVLVDQVDKLTRKYEEMISRILNKFT